MEDSDTIKAESVTVPLPDLMVILQYMETYDPAGRADILNALDRLGDITLIARMKAKPTKRDTSSNGSDKLDPVAHEQLSEWLLMSGYAEEQEGYGHVSADALAAALLERFEMWVRP